MSKLLIEGGHRIKGEISVHGSKNSALPILAATFLLDSQSVIKNCPKLTDVNVAMKILRYLGCEVTIEDNVITVNPSDNIRSEIPDELMREMRSSIVFLGAIISRAGKARISMPGGCELGSRPIDLHLAALEQLGVIINEDHGYLECRCRGRLKGANISLSFPSVGATENIILAASTAFGETVIINAAREPEIVDLANFLNSCGAKISGAGESIIVIEGVEKLSGCEHNVIPDRIVATTFMAFAATTRGELLIKDINAEHISSVIPLFKSAGCYIKQYNQNLYIRADERLNSVKMIRTMPYPGFPTDAQAQLMAMSCYADGTSVFVESIFENRFKHVPELTRMGAKINVEGRVAIVEGIAQLHSASVKCTDLRGGASLVVAALGANGLSDISDIHHIDRGYESIEKSLSSIGAYIKRVDA